ncbi:MAG: solute carrier family 35 protein [archaeon]|nr:solute carrier family 35 protein [archaeon]
MNEQRQHFGRTLFYMGAMLITGSINTIANKLQQNSSSLGIDYVHQKFITFTMFIGESLCFWIYLIKCNCKKEDISPEDMDTGPLTKDNFRITESSFISESDYSNVCKNEESFKEDFINEDINKTNSTEEKLIKNSENDSECKIEKKKKRKAKCFYFALPAFFDLLGTSTMSISLTFLPSSVYQMLRGAVIIFTVISSIIFLKYTYHRHHFLGICIAICGLVIVGLDAILWKDKEKREKVEINSSMIIGISLVLIGQIFQSFMFIVEENLIKKFKAEPLQVVGMEGLWGASFYIILLIPLYYIKCDEWPKDFQKMCQPENAAKTEFRFEDALLAFRQLKGNSQLIFFACLYILSIALFNFSGLSVTKNASSTSRTMADALRTILIWIFFLTEIPPEQTREDFSWPQLGGFIILLIGSIIYNEIIELPCCKFNENTRRARKEREIIKRAASVDDVIESVPGFD